MDKPGAPEITCKPPEAGGETEKRTPPRPPSSEKELSPLTP